MSLNQSEIKSALNCIPYFSKEPIIFDIGSNKGEFTDLFIDNASEIHLFEPNEMLLTYTKVKYCDRNNMHYSKCAIYKERKNDLDFYYFTNENNGLSSIYNNHEWDNLPKKRMSCVGISIDEYREANKIQNIDFIKIDIEGAEWDAIQGAKNTLKTKSVKYIQIEYSPHYKLNDYRFIDIIKFVNRYGYKVYSCEIEGMEYTPKNFIEDYKLENYIIKNSDIVENWNDEFIKNTFGMRFNFALEIGAFEGLTSCYICDNLLTENGRVIAVDPLKNQYLTGDLSKEDEQLNKDLSSMYKGQYSRFKRNTKGRPIELIRKTSREAFSSLKDYRFDFIYVNGDFRKDEVYNDGIEAFQILKIGGYMLFDDYKWRPETAEGINMFLNLYYECFDLVKKGYQVMIKKTDEYYGNLTVET